MHRSHFADRVRAFLLAAALVSALICPQALAADAAGSGGCAHGHTLTTCRGGKSVCAVCGETVDIRAAQYTGWLTVEGTADRMYFLSGEHVTGWQQLDGGTYHFDDDGIVHDTETVDTRTCTTNGYAITTCRTCGETCRSAVLRYAGHSWDADHVCTKCGTQGKNIADAQVKTAPAVYNGKDAVCAVAVTYQGRQLTVRTDEADVDGCISYTNNTRVGLGTVSIRGMRDFYGTVSAQYEILPGGVRDAAAAEIGQKQVRLDWTAAAGAENYRVEMSADGGSTDLAAAGKRSYQLRLDQACDLATCGEAAERWTLLACCDDATLLHDKLFRELAVSLGMPYTPAADWVDLYYDGVYRGTYLVSETNAVGSTGVDITGMETAYAAVNADYGSDMTTAAAENRYGRTYRYTAGLTEPADITGGYLLARSDTAKAKQDAANGFVTARGCAMNVQSPAWCGRDAMAYISEYYQAFEDAVYAQDAAGNYTGYNAETGKYYYEYCDLTSLVQVYLLQRLAADACAVGVSLSFYKDAGGLLYAGPVSDMELACGDIGADDDFDGGRYLVSALLQIPGFRAAVGNYCHDTFLAQAQRLVGDGGRVMTGGAHLSASAAMNDRLWPLIRAGDRAWPAGTTYADTVADMDAWLTARIAQMRAAYAHTWDAGVVTREPTCTSTGTRVYTSDAGETMTETIPSRAHAPEALPAVAATCTTPGLTEGSRCAFCGEVLTAQEAIPAAHRYVNGVCTVCGARDPVSAPCPGGKACPGSRFTDMPPAGNWAHNAIDFTVAHKLFAGMSDTTFAPNARLTRAMIVMILYRLEGEPAAAAESAFTDVRSGAWYAGAIGWAAGSGIVNGVGGGRFDPNGLATREQTAAILYRYARFKGCDLDACGDLSAFADAGSVSAFALAPMTWAVGERLISGNAIGGRTLLDPQGVTTRAQFATIMMRYILNVVQPAPEP